MFNYDELTVTLSVTPEISAPMFGNYYTKQEADDRFVEEAPQTPEGAVYGRKYKQWESLQLPNEVIYVGYFQADEPKFVEVDDLEQFILEGAQTSIFYHGVNDNNQKRLWICSPYKISSVVLADPETGASQGLPVPVDYMGVSRAPHPVMDVDMYFYRTGKLKANNYGFNISFIKE